MAFSDRLRARRLERGLTQEELADRAGMSVRAVGDLERGQSKPHRSTIDRLSAVLDASLTPAAPTKRPMQLPHGAAGFLGREAELTRLRALMRRPSPGICIIDGPGGVGKTALAVHFGHAVADEFPDGQLYADLRGFDVRQQPLEPTVVLGSFLRALDVDVRRMPTDPDERAAAYRSAMSGRRMLVVLDNAAVADQVRALLPGAARCLVLITSRCRLSGLVARDGADSLTLRGFTAGDAVDLLTAIIGVERTAQEPKAPAALAKLCGYLPLALRITAERARLHGSLGDLVAGLGDERQRLNLLATDDESTNVRTVFSWSYHALDSSAARLFRLLGAHPGRDFTPRAAAALADRADAGIVLDRLVGRHLLERGDDDRYHFHDLMRTYAAELTDANVQAAQRRLVRWYLAAAVAVDRIVSPQRYRIGLDQVTSDHPLPPLRSRQDALRWYDVELPNLIAVVQLATALDEHRWAWQLSWALGGCFDLRRSWDAWLTTSRASLHAASAHGDHEGEAAMLTSLALAHYYPRHFAEADEFYRRARDIWTDLGDPRGEAIALNGIGNVYLETRRFDDAITFYQQALVMNRAASDSRGEGVVLSNLAETYCELGRLADAESHARAALEVNRTTNNTRGLAFSLCHLARSLPMAQAEPHYREAIAIARRDQDQHVEAWALEYFGMAQASSGRPHETAACWRRAADLFDTLQDPRAAELRGRLAALSSPLVQRRPRRLA